jgi:hypothetical protein
MDLISSPENWRALLTLSWKIVGRWCRAGMPVRQVENRVPCSRHKELPGPGGHRRRGPDHIIALSAGARPVLRPVDPVQQLSSDNRTAACAALTRSSSGAVARLRPAAVRIDACCGPFPAACKAELTDPAVGQPWTKLSFLAFSVRMVKNGRFGPQRLRVPDSATAWIGRSSIAGGRSRGGTDS